MKIALLCPTKNRVTDVERLILSLENTVSNFSNITLYLGVDSDDSHIPKLLDMSRFKSYVQVVKLKSYGHFPGLGKIWNEMAWQVPEEIFAMTGDDYVYETPGWDQMILDEFKNMPGDGLYMVHCNDGLHGPGNRYHDRYIQAVNSFIYRKYLEVNGYYLREEFMHQFVDTWLDEVYTRLDRKVYRHDIMIRHLHFSQTGIMDNTTKNLRAHSNYKDDIKKFMDLKIQRETEIDNLKQYIEHISISC